MGIPKIGNSHNSDNIALRPWNPSAIGTEEFATMLAPPEERQDVCDGSRRTVRVKLGHPSFSKPGLARTRPVGCPLAAHCRICICEMQQVNDTLSDYNQQIFQTEHYLQTISQLLLQGFTK